MQGEFQYILIKKNEPLSKRAASDDSDYIGIDAILFIKHGIEDYPLETGGLK
jgi:hypothetical protein